MLPRCPLNSKKSFQNKNYLKSIAKLKSKDQELVRKDPEEDLVQEKMDLGNKTEID
jgi:hypothetical protein